MQKDLCLDAEFAMAMNGLGRESSLYTLGSWHTPGMHWGLLGHGIHT